MPAVDSLKRLGGGRWESRDGRFAIEPQSGTWVVVDTMQTDDLGLPLVRGPFGSLTAAKEAIEGARQAGPAESPLAERIRLAARAEPRKPKAAGKAAASKPSTPDKPERPPESKWLRDLEPADRLRAFQLIERLDGLHLVDAEEIARAEIAGDQPAVARLALERSLRKVMASTQTPAGAVRAAVEAILAGKDRELGVSWRLVDDRGRPLDKLDISD
jgi:hypothetical protein